MDRGCLLGTVLVDPLGDTERGLAVAETAVGIALLAAPVGVVDEVTDAAQEAA